MPTGRNQPRLRSLAGFFWRRKLLSLALLISAGLAITPAIVLTRTFAIIHPAEVPSLQPSQPLLEKQTEGFTCGVHALGTIYRAHGLDPGRERIRWRLGVDTKALWWAKDTTGALHPDVFMVLNQDFFAINSLDLSSSMHRPLTPAPPACEPRGLCRSVSIPAARRRFPPGSGPASPARCDNNPPAPPS
jgi:hypothetical protein